MALVLATTMSMACSPSWTPAPASAEATWSNRCYRFVAPTTSLMGCIESCASLDAAPVCISSASEADFINDWALPDLQRTGETNFHGVWIGAYRSWSGDGTNNGINDYEYSCATGGAIPYSDWLVGAIDEGFSWTYVDPGYRPSPENASTVVLGTRHPDSDCVRLPGSKPPSYCPAHPAADALSVSASPLLAGLLGQHHRRRGDKRI